MSKITVVSSLAVICFASCTSEDLTLLKENIIEKPIARIKQRHALEMDQYVLNEVKQSPIEFYKRGGFARVAKMTHPQLKSEALSIGASVNMEENKSLARQLVEELKKTYPKIERISTRNSFALEHICLMYDLSPDESLEMMKKFEQSIEDHSTHSRATYFLNMTRYYLELPKDVSKAKELLNRADKTIGYISNNNTRVRLVNHSNRIKDQFSHLLMD